MDKSIHTKEYATLVEKLKRARLEAGLTQVTAAKKLKCSQSYISKVEAGELRLDVIELQQFADLYRKDMSYFLQSRKA
jgi:transcriptional regulator with XRE-family HTH domain